MTSAAREKEISHKEEKTKKGKYQSLSPDMNVLVFVIKTGFSIYGKEA